ncbi:MAG: transcriptional repressor [Firmicutes bacterium]|nr:transcriptional repressor [Alicyclobacillaceae bacterium]MCL6497467.1 transcriptional repressor [Bacillota bacterium]
MAGWVAALHTAGLRATPQRLAVLSALAHLSHPDAETVYAAVKPSYPTLSLATVYNTLDRLSAAGLIQPLRVGERRRFDPRTDPHNHLYCRRCQRLEDVDPAELPPAPADLAADWELDAASVTWSGLCPRCRQEVKPGS